MTVQDYIFSGAIVCLALSLLWGLAVVRREDGEDREHNNGPDPPGEPPDDYEPDLNTESGRERQLREYQDKYR